MEFDFRRFVKKGLIDAIGKQGDHWVRLNAAEWHVKGVLNEEDLAEIEAVIDAKNKETQYIEE
jgi:hypothetical protein